ncbi:MAG: hypothetical protein HRU35_07640 [Rickettsiaceae bacterium]|nr:hypothetical protein [Rickettsiaceae bacterium]
MDKKKQQFIEEIVITVTEVATTHTEKKYHSSVEENLINLVGVDIAELGMITTFVVNYFPEKLYLEKYQEVKEHFGIVVAEQFLLFLTREDKTAEYFKNNLENFRQEMLAILLNDYYIEDDGSYSTSQRF